MNRTLGMSTELGEWLAELCSSEPAAAADVGAAVVAAMDAPDILSLAAVAELTVPASVDPADLVAAAEDAARTVSSALGPLREQLAEAASYRHTTRQRLTPHGSYPHPFSAAEVAEFARRERELIGQLQSCQQAADSFRMRQVAAAARYTSAAALRDIQRTLLAATDQTPAERAAAQAELTAAEASLASSEAELAGLLPEATALLRAFNQAAGTADAEAVTPGLLELRADPLGREIRILLAVEPADAVTLLAVLDGAAAKREHGGLAVKLAGEVLAELRAGGSPQALTGADQAVASGAAELTFASPGAFLARYFPGSEAELRQRSAMLAGATTLGRLRRQRDLTLADLAGRTGLTARELWHLEAGGLTAARVADVAGYLRALGGRLRVTAEFDGEQQILV